MTTYGDFIKIIDSEGVTDAPRLAKVLLEDLSFPKENIFIILDKDINDRPEQDNTMKIIQSLESNGWDKNTNLIQLGAFKEFEDLFSPEIIYESWKLYVEKRGGQLGDSWTLENIKNLKKTLW